MHNLWSFRLILPGCTPVLSSSSLWAAVSPWASGSLLPLSTLLQPRTHTTKHKYTWKENPEWLGGYNWVKTTKNPSYGTQLRAKREFQAQKSKNVMPDCSCCLVLAVPVSLSTLLFFLKKELLLCWEPSELDDAGQSASILKFPPLPWEHQNLLLLLTWLPGPPYYPERRHGALLSSRWK